MSKVQMVYEVELRAQMPWEVPKKGIPPKRVSLLFSDENLILPSLRETYSTTPGISIEDKRAEGAMFIVRWKDGRTDIFDVTQRYICTMPEHF